MVWPPTRLAGSVDVDTEEVIPIGKGGGYGSGSGSCGYEMNVTSCSL